MPVEFFYKCNNIHLVINNHSTKNNKKGVFKIYESLSGYKYTEAIE